MSKKSKNEGPAPTPLPDKNKIDNLSEKEIKHAFESLVKRKFSKEQNEQANHYKELDRILKETIEDIIKNRNKNINKIKVIDRLDIKKESIDKVQT